MHTSTYKITCTPVDVRSQRTQDTPDQMGGPVAAWLDHDTSAGAACTQCALGSFKSFSGPQACSMCPRNTSSSGVGSTDVTGCKCNAGLTGLDGGEQCVPCYRGSYKDVLGDSACLPCPSNSSTKAGSAKLVDCRCSRGFSGADGALCVPCSAGSYKNATGNCLACAAGTYTSETASFECTHCPTRATSSPGSVVLTDCICNKGYTGLRFWYFQKFLWTRGMRQVPLRSKLASRQ